MVQQCTEEKLTDKGYVLRLTFERHGTIPSTVLDNHILPEQPMPIQVVKKKSLPKELVVLFLTVVVHDKLGLEDVLN